VVPLRFFNMPILARLTLVEGAIHDINLTLLLARPGVSVRSGPRIFNRVDPSRIS
jgi:hypothetical protein